MENKKINETTALMMATHICQFMAESANGATGFILGIALGAKHQDLGNLIEEKLIAGPSETERGMLPENGRVVDDMVTLLNEFSEAATLVEDGGGVLEYVTLMDKLSQQEASNEHAGHGCRYDPNQPPPLDDNGIAPLTPEDEAVFKRLIDEIGLGDETDEADGS